MPAGREPARSPAPWAAIPDAVAGLDWTGRIVIDATNPIMAPDFHVADLDGHTSGEVVAALAIDRATSRSTTAASSTC